MIDYQTIFGTTRNLVTIVATVILFKYFVYLALAPFYTVRQQTRKLRIKKLEKDGHILKNYTPKVSVLIPAWNEQAGIINTVKSVLSSTYNNIQVVVINDGSTDQTHNRVKDFLRDYSRNIIAGKSVKYISQENRGKGAALNAGVKHSNGEIILTMDADSVHDKNAIANLVEYFKDPAIDCVVGNVKIQNNATLTGVLQKLEYLFGFYFKRVHSIFNAEYIFGGACAAFRRSTTFGALGLFDENNKTEDIEFSMRTKMCGLKSIYAENVITYTEGASSLRGLYKQRLRWKKGRIDTFFKYRALFFSTHPDHSKFLTWFVLPYAIIGEIQMFLEPIFFALIASYTILSGDFLSIGISSLFISFTFIAAILLGDKKSNPIYIFTFPAIWILFYLLVLIEFLALIKSLELTLSRKDVVWQKWARRGIKLDEKVAIQI